MRRDFEEIRYIAARTCTVRGMAMGARHLARARAPKKEVLGLAGAAGAATMHRQRSAAGRPAKPLCGRPSYACIQITRVHTGGAHKMGHGHMHTALQLQAAQMVNLDLDSCVSTSDGHERPERMSCYNR